MYPPPSYRNGEPESFAAWLASMVDEPIRSIAAMVAELESLAEVTPETREAYLADDVSRRADRVLAEIDPGQAGEGGKAGGPEASPAPEPLAGQVEALQAHYLALAATVRGWIGEVRRRSEALEPLLPADEEARDALRDLETEPLAFYLYESGEHLAQDFADLVALLMVYGEATEDPSSREPRRDREALAEEIWQAEDPKAPRGEGERS